MSRKSVKIFLLAGGTVFALVMLTSGGYLFNKQYVISARDDARVETSKESEATVSKPIDFGDDIFNIDTTELLAEVDACEADLLSDLGNSRLNYGIHLLSTNLPNDSAPAIMTYYYFEGMNEEIVRQSCKLDLMDLVTEAAAAEGKPISWVDNVLLDYRTVYVTYMTEVEDTTYNSAIAKYNIETGKFEVLTDDGSEWLSYELLSVVSSNLLYTVYVEGPAPCSGECTALLEQKEEEYSGIWIYNEANKSSTRLSALPEVE